VTAVSTHVLDTARGVPAAGVQVVLEAYGVDGWLPLVRATTDADGRAAGLTGVQAAPGLHRLVFATGAYLGDGAFFPEVTVAFEVDDRERLHVPLLLSPFGYSTYRGS
jgi:5-hydroxyisourate hydrolase